MTEGTIRAWLVDDGTEVHVGQPVLIIETDKVETEVEAREDGVLARIGVVGETYECGAVIGYLAEPGDLVSRSSALESFVAPLANDTVEADRDRVLASPRARVIARERGIDLATVHGTGPLGRIVGDDVMAARRNVEVAPALPSRSRAPALVTGSAEVAASSDGFATAGSPGATAGARMLADLLGVDLRHVPVQAGTRVSREDVASWVRAQLASSGRGAAEAAASPAAESSTPVRATVRMAPLLQEPTEIVPFSGMRGLIAQRMHGSLTEMAQLTLSVDVDMSAVNEARDRAKAADKAVPGYTAWVAAAASRALVAHPYVNSQVIADGIAILPEVHLGVAVALDIGLIVPVVKHADRRSVEELHEEVADLAARAHEGSLSLPDLEGATFSLTALGMYGVDMFTPVINPPNTAILGVGRLRTETDWTDGVPTPRTVMTLSLTWDHRAFDGAPAAQFARSIVGFLEDPSTLVE